MRGEKRDKQGALSVDLTMRLTAYSATAGAVLAMGSPAESAIHVFTPPTPLLVDSGHPVSVDMDQDGTGDFTFSTYGSRFTYSYGCGTGSASTVFVLKVRRNDMAARFDGNTCRIEKGKLIDASFDKNDQRLMDARKHCRYASSFSSGACSDPRWSNGPLNDGAQGYLGVKFRGRDGLDHNGWILFKGGTDPAHLSGTVLSWAYEDSEGAIKAGDDHDTISLTFLPDLNGNGAKEYALLNEVQGFGFKTSVLIKDLATNKLLREVECLGAQFRPVSLLRIDDLDGSGSPGLALLGVRESAAGKTLQVKVQLRDPRTGNFIRDIPFDKTYNPKALFWLNDLDGNAICELALLGENPLTGKAAVQIRDSLTGALVKNLAIASGKQVASVALWALPDLNGNGSWELAVLQHDGSTGLSWIDVFDTQTFRKIKTVSCLDATLIPVGMAWVRDMNGNGYPELGILAGSQAGNKIFVEIRDVLTGESLKTIAFSNRFLPVGLAAADLSGDKGFELAVLETSPAAALTRIEIRDSLTGRTVKILRVP